MMRIFVDGGTRGSRICLHDPQKNKTIIKVRENNHILTNNELEYLALLYGLEYVRNNYPRNTVTLCTDSLLIANQMNGTWRVTTEKLIPLHRKCTKLLREDLSVKWISRDVNPAGHALEK